MTVMETVLGISVIGLAIALLVTRHQVQSMKRKSNYCLLLLSTLLVIGCAPTYPIVYKMQLKDNERLIVNPNESVIITVNKDSVEIEKE